MAVTVRIPAPYRVLTGGLDEVEAQGATVGAVIDDLDRTYPGLKDRLCDADGVRRSVNVYANEEDIRFLEDLDTPLADGDAVDIVPALAGGAR
ncbi:MAG: MoaD family protein [Sandaracinaceae bacterium]